MCACLVKIMIYDLAEKTYFALHFRISEIRRKQCQGRSSAHLSGLIDVDVDAEVILSLRQMY